jgi:Tol biopolymer transport system component
LKRITFLLVLLYLVLGCTGLGAYYYGQNKVNSVYTQWSQIETMHFDIYFPRGNDNFGRLAALMAEDAYYYLKRDFQFPAMSRIPVIFYSSQLEFETTNIIYALLSEGIGGFTESLKNRVVIPFDGSYARLEQVLTHELTHAYINALDAGSPGSFFYLKSFSFPDWFAEGLPEYEAVGGTDVNNNAYVLDLVLNDKIGSLNEASGYSNYRLGESFLVFLQKRYGRAKVMDYLYALRALNDGDKATQKVFGLDFKDLETRWRTQLKRDYYSYIQSHALPSEYSEQKTRHRDDGSYLNLAPRFSPDGQKYVYFSNRNGRYSVWRGGLYEHSVNRKLITGEATGKMEEFHYLRSNLAWFPDNQRFAYAAKTAFGDKIYIADYDKGKILDTISLPQMKAVYEIDISRDGEYCVFSGQKDMQADLYLYEFKTKALRQLTNDMYYDYQPRFSPDGKTIAFASERTGSRDDFRQGHFSNLRSNLYTLGLSDTTLSQVTFETYNCYYPVWDSAGTRLAFVSERDSLPNLEIIDPVSGQRATVTKTLSGIYSFDFNQNDRYLVYSCFFDGGWDIYLKTEPLADTVFAQNSKAVQVTTVDTLLNRIDLKRLDFYGRKKQHKPVADGGPVFTAKHPTVFDFKPEADSVRAPRDFSWDDRPDSVSVLPLINPYKVRFKLDGFYGGMAYSSSVGAIGSLVLELSDILGNHAIGIDLALAGKLKDSNILLTYLYLPRRIDYGIGVYNLLDDTDYYFYDAVGQDYDYLRNSIRETGLYYLMRYPLNRFLRLDWENQLYTWEEHWKYSDSGNEGTYHDILPVDKDIIYTPSLTLVHDNSLYGATGPLLGWRTYLTLSKSFAKQENTYQTAYLDFRSYALFNKRYSMALRLVGGSSGGERPQTFQLNGYYGLRGYDKDTEGKHLALASAELRFPFLDYLALAFPLPLVMGSVRGSAFADLGGVWDDNFRGMADERLKDLHLGIGFGPRLNIGIAVLKFDIAWLTDLSATSKPTYYLSLTEDF